GGRRRRDEGDDPVLPIELPTAAATAAGAAERLAPPPRRAPSGCAPVTTLTSSTSGPMSPADVRKGSGVDVVVRAGRAQDSKSSELRQGSWLLLWIFLGGIALVGVYSALFLVLMAREGQSHSWASSLYWTITTMSTVGYGDIT